MGRCGLVWESWLEPEISGFHFYFIRFYSNKNQPVHISTPYSPLLLYSWILGCSMIRSWVWRSGDVECGRQHGFITLSFHSLAASLWCRHRTRTLLTVLLVNECTTYLKNEKLFVQYVLLGISEYSANLRLRRTISILKAEKIIIWLLSHLTCIKYLNSHMQTSLLNRNYYHTRVQWKIWELKLYQENLFSA